MSPNPSLTTSSAFDLLRDEVDARLAKFHAAISDASASVAVLNGVESNGHRAFP